MSEIALLLGLGIVASILTYITFQLDTEHKLLKILLLFMVMSSFVLVSKASLDASEYCDIVVNETVDTGGDKEYFYERVCFENPNSTAETFHNVVLWIWRLFATYIFLYTSWKALQWLVESFRSG